jgi:hypothetical protein
MGQCSTLPAEGRTATSIKRGESASFRREESLQKPTQGRKSPQVHTQNQPSGQFPPMAHDNHQPQARNPEVHSGLDPMEEDHPRDGVPQPPDIATRTRCYKLHLNSDIHPQSPVYLGPFTDLPPPLTFSTSEDSSVDVTPTQVAIQTAKIFRGITVGKDGTILSQNARVTRSNRNSKNKKGEQSRQASKIEKAKDLVEESILTGKVSSKIPRHSFPEFVSAIFSRFQLCSLSQAPDSDEPANMVSLVVMGEYDDVKHLVRDGSKKLRETSELPDDSLLSVNKTRNDMNLRSPRKRVSPNYAAADQRGSTLQTPNKMRPVGLPQSAPPKLKRNPRDHPGSRIHTDDKNQSRDTSGYQGDANHSRQSASNAGEGDWSNTLNFSRGFHSIWNCGGTRGDDTGTASPTEVTSPRNGKSQSLGGVAAPQYRPVFEGRDSNFGQVRETGVSTRAN